ncbi:MAG: PilN domain-containing protein [Desulfobacterales bacterium]|nr:PilN domain-containing protein [Deltaproteobacteria bacterium]NNL42314.1 PilN domain-containing protein [Desulfobacterales bacterium]
MIRINLLPFRAARKKENVRRQVSIFFLSFFFVVIVLVYFHISLGSKTSRLRSKKEITKKEVAKFKKINQEIAALKKKLQILKKKTSVIESLEKNRFEPVRLLDTMSLKVIAKRMWFKSFKSIGRTVEIEGLALDNKTVADFMTRLQGSGLFSVVKLKTIKKAKVKESDLKSFQISCTRKDLSK